MELLNRLYRPKGTGETFRWKGGEVAKEKRITFLGKRNNQKKQTTQILFGFDSGIEPYYDKNVASLAFDLFQTGSQGLKILKIFLSK